MENKKSDKLNFESLDMQIFMGELFAECRTQKEVEWLQEQITGVVEGTAEERIEEIE